MTIPTQENKLPINSWISCDYLCNFPLNFKGITPSYDIGFEVF